MSLKNFFIAVFRNLYLNLRYKIDSKPRLRYFIYFCYDIIRLVQHKIKLKIFTKFSHTRNLIYVNPEKIIYEKDLVQNNWRLFLKFIKPLINPVINNSIQRIGGDWDLKINLKLFSEDIKYISYFQHFIKDIDWKNTPYYKREAERYLEGKVRREYKSVEDLNLKYKYHDKLFNKIKLEGFKSQHDIIKSEGHVINFGRGTILRKEDDDITVGISRKGDIIFFDGRHRLNIAKLLKIEKIPVRVLVIHPNFLLKSKN